MGCKAEGGYVCKSCMAGIVMLGIQECPNCRGKREFGDFCSIQCKKGFYLDNLIVCTEYKKVGLIRDLLKGIKYKFLKEISEVLGKTLSIQFQIISERMPRLKRALVVPVPIHKKRLKYRGYNQSFLLAKYLADNCGLELKECLFWKRYLKQQAGLRRDERIKNKINSVGLLSNVGLRGKDILIIDDVATTLSTLNECAKILQKNGARDIYCFVVSRAGRFC